MKELRAWIAAEAEAEVTGEEEAAKIRLSRLSTLFLDWSDVFFLDRA